MLSVWSGNDKSYEIRPILISKKGYLYALI